MPEYQQWMTGFAKGTRHVALNPQAVSGIVSLPSPASLQVILLPLTALQRYACTNIVRDLGFACVFALQLVALRSDPELYKPIK